MQHPILRDDVSLHKLQPIGPFLSIIAIRNLDRRSGETLVRRSRVQIGTVP